MLPSPSLAPPWLSLSASPALGPWGMPEELELPALDPVDVAAGALEDFDEDEPPPQPATPIAARTRASAIHRRAVIQVMFMVCLSTYMDGYDRTFLPAVSPLRPVPIRRRSRSPGR